MSQDRKFISNLLTHPVTAIFAMVIGFLVGLYSKTATFYLAPLGMSYLSLLVMCILPVLFASIIYGLASLLRDVNMYKNIKRIFIVFIVGAFLSSAVGVLVGSVGQAKLRLSSSDVSSLGSSMQAIEYYPPLSGGIVGKPTVMESVMMFFQQVTPKNVIGTLGGGLSLQVVVLAALIGVALGVLKMKQADDLLGMVKTVDSVFKEIFGWLLYILPLGLCGIFAQIASTFDFRMLHALMRFVFLFYLSGVLLFLFYQVVFAVMSKSGFLHSLKILKKTMILTFLVESSVITLPLTISALDKLKINKKISNLLMPLGVVINQQGKVLFFALLTIFICTLYGIHLSVTSLVFIFFLSAVTGMAASGNGLVLAPSFVIIAKSLGIPAEVSVLILGVTAPVMPRLMQLLTVSANCASIAVIDRFASQTEEVEESRQE